MAVAKKAAKKPAPKKAGKSLPPWLAAKKSVKDKPTAKVTCPFCNKSFVPKP